jgi:hypothetical protein
VRRETGRALEAATTFTVTRGNLEEVPLVMRWLRSNANAFKMISFQPIAQVGRTEEGLADSAPIEELWAVIARGLLGDEARPSGRYYDDLRARQRLADPLAARTAIG